MWPNVTKCVRIPSAPLRIIVTATTDTNLSINIGTQEIKHFLLIEITIFSPFKTPHILAAFRIVKIVCMALALHQISVIVLAATKITVPTAGVYPDVSSHAETVNALRPINVNAWTDTSQATEIHSIANRSVRRRACRDDALVPISVSASQAIN